MNDRRLIEAAFPLRQASLDSLHEKNVRHGHISTLHIWPARRPLAASRAALIATLLPDPGTVESRSRWLERIGGRVTTRIETKKLGPKTLQLKRDETIGGVLHWGREASPDLASIRQAIREAYGGRAPRVLDPFAGGGAIPLEAMRLGCDVTATDINPVAWVILRCTLEHAQRLTGQHRPLPAFALESPDFMRTFLEGTSKLTQKQLERQLGVVQARMFPPPDVDLAWHLRAWGHWVLERARTEIGPLYPVIDGHRPVAYLWARTIICKNCRAAVPMLRTLWLCRKARKRLLLTLTPTPDKGGVTFGIERDVAVVGGNAAQRREHDRRLGQGTTSRAGVMCSNPTCRVITSLEDYQYQGRTGGLGQVLLAVVVDTEGGKDYRVPALEEVAALDAVAPGLEEAAAKVQFGAPDEPISHERPSPNARGMSGLTRFGIDQHQKLYSPRQLLALLTVTKLTGEACSEAARHGYPEPWVEAIREYLYCTLARVADRSSTLCTWQTNAEKIGHTFARYALTMTTDYAEASPLADSSGGYPQAIEWVARVVEHLQAIHEPGQASVTLGSADSLLDTKWDLVLTDPPYYDSVPYADVMDYFYVWARRVLGAKHPNEFASPLAPREKEFIQHAGRLGGDNEKAKLLYESNMAAAFVRVSEAMAPEGRFVIVFAHKDPTAWETLVSAIIAAGFTVDASWPIQTERGARMLALSSAALSSSVWLVCKKRPQDARAGWDNRVLEDMRTSINVCLRAYWDAGIRGPDFVWAATGPALEPYSKHPVVKKANEPGLTLDVPEFLREVRRIVVDFVVGRVLNPSSEEETASGLDDLTTYYLLHRNDFRLEDAPIGPCILYAVSCGLSDADLADEHDLLARTGGSASSNGDEDSEEPEDSEAEVEEGTGSKVRLKTWQQRKAKGMGYDGDGRPAPLIDQVHRLLHLWKAGDQVKVDEYLEARALVGNRLFHRVLQALIELADEGSEERALLESISNHVAGKRPELAAQVPGWDIRRGGQSEEGEGT